MKRLRSVGWVSSACAVLGMQSAMAFLPISLEVCRTRQCQHSSSLCSSPPTAVDDEAIGLTPSPPSQSVPDATPASFNPFPFKARPGLLFAEETNFCLQPGEVDTPLVSVSRVLNTFANRVVKKILIGADFCLKDLATAVKDQVRTEHGQTDLQLVEAADCFVDAVSALSPCSELEVAPTREALRAPYVRAYERVLDVLLGANSELRSDGVGEQGEKVVPRDRDFCLSLYDSLTTTETKTKVLNSISNRVVRTMLYGDEEDVSKLLHELEGKQQAFLEHWGVGDNDEAVLYYHSLMAHLRSGLDVTPPPAMRGSYGNAYQRLVTLLVQELGTGSAGSGTQVNAELLDSFVRWESSLRKNLTREIWDEHPRELTGQWTLLDGAKGTTLKIGFRKDGSVKVPAELGIEGSWRLEPGPTHLDTVYFDVKTGSADGRALNYAGYVDRGQRIETRFSKRPIKVQGRMILTVRAEARASTRFQMELRRKDRGEP